MGTSTYPGAPDVFDVPSNPDDEPLGSAGDSAPSRDHPQMHDDMGAAIHATQVELDTHKAAADPHAQYQRESEKGVANGYPALDAGGKIPVAQVPAVALTDTFVVNSQAAMLALAAEHGDVAVRTDLSKSFILATDDPTTLANWKELLTPPDVVSSVDGMTGAVVLPHDAAAGTPSMRTLGAGAAQAAAGNDARLSDARAPTAHAALHNPGGADALTQLVDRQTFSASGASNWVAPAWWANAKAVRVVVIGAGGGAGSGRRGAAASARFGGGAGGGGAVSEVWISPADLPVAAGGNINVTVGAKGPGGAAQTVDSTDGVNGTSGGGSFFGPSAVAAYCAAGGGVRGNGGTAAAGAGGSGGAGEIAGAAGASAGAAGGAGATGTAGGGAPGGGSGGGITAADAVSAGGAGNAPGKLGGNSAGGPAGGAAGANGNNGASPIPTSGTPGTSGSGGGSSITGVGGTGGNGGPGAGGGGGGASLNGNNSGKGGDGGDGFVMVVVFG